MNFAKTIIGLFSLLALTALALWAIQDLWVVILLTLFIGVGISLVAGRKG